MICSDCGKAQYSVGPVSHKNCAWCGSKKEEDMSENLEKLDPEAQESLDGSPAGVIIDGAEGDDAAPYAMIKFQCGPIKEHGVNGTTIEAVAQLLVDRLEGFQKGPFRCRENAIVITKFQEAIHWLEHRTKDRQARGVEGINKQ